MKEEKNLMTNNLDEQIEFVNLPETEDILSIKTLVGLIRCQKIKPTEFRVYFAIYTLRYCNEIRPSRVYLAQKTGNCSVRTITRSIDILCELGLLERLEQRRTKDGYYASNKYRLNDLVEWLKKNNEPWEYWTGLSPEIMYCPYLTNNETRLYAVIKSWNGLDNPIIPWANLEKWTSLSRVPLFAARKSLIEKGLLIQGRAKTEYGGDLGNSYYIANESNWLKSLTK